MFKRISNRAKTLMFTAMCMLMLMATSVVAFAESETANAALVTAANSAASSITANINAVLPIALGLMGIVLAITIGVKVFKKLTNKAG